MASFLAFCGSARQASFNQKSLNCISTALEARAASVTRLDLNEFPLPIYHGDEEDAEGLPAPAARFKDLLHSHDALVVGCPEYNGFMTPLLLNLIDWATRSEEATPDLSGFQGKPVLVTSCSPGSLGGIRAAAHLKSMLTGIGCVVSPESFMVPRAFAAFAEDGSPKDEALKARADVVAEYFLTFTQKLTG